ncbi:Ribokinase-like protein [Macrolepiota fuliginosa MF-IS2]|uniref:Ribokinase n=1 Tax=Macrolepiota fuliginosa MF-IS2 TaxID=1400762 RepID=A0A9P6BXP5_9AGAR|nr:Ribokinase-like protein [Macrolepiota fuliginosa MF-IS2]
MPHCLARGSINLDEYYYVPHISRPGETISSHDFQQRMGGKGFNQAVALALATGGGDQGKVSFYGTVGDDEAGAGLREKLYKKWRIRNDTLVVDPTKATGRAIIQVADDGENSIVLFPGANHSEVIETLEKSWPAGTTHVLLQNEISLASTLKAIASAEKLTTIFNPSPMLSEEEIVEFPWSKIDWLIINQLEAQSLLASFAPEKAPDKIQEMLRDLARQPALSTTRIICTLGADGVLAMVPGIPIVFVPAAQLEGPVVDTTGAGDTFAGYFVAELMSLDRQEVKEAEVIRLLEAATRAAGMCVERAGTVDSMPAAEEVERRFGVSRGR